MAVKNRRLTLSCWHNENPKFNDVWEEFIFDSAGNATNRSKQEILEKLSDMRSSYQATQ